MGEITWTPEMEAERLARVAKVQETIRTTNYRFGTIGEHELGPVTTNGAWFIVEREDEWAYYGYWKTGCWPPGEVRFPKSQYTYPVDDATREQWIEDADTFSTVFASDAYPWPAE